MAKKKNTQEQRNQTQQQHRMEPRSKAWDYFIRGKGPNGKENATCMLCSKEYAYHGTKNLLKHIPVCPRTMRGRRRRQPEPDASERQRIQEELAQIKEHKDQLAAELAETKQALADSKKAFADLEERSQRAGVGQSSQEPGVEREEAIKEMCHDMFYKTNRSKRGRTMLGGHFNKAPGKTPLSKIKEEVKEEPLLEIKEEPLLEIKEVKEESDSEKRMMNYYWGTKNRTKRTKKI